MPGRAFTTTGHIEQLRAEADRFVVSLADADLDATVVTCPDWTVRDLVRHVGGLHRWSTELVSDGIVAETWRSSLPIVYPDEAAPIAVWRDWLVAGAAEACHTFLAAEPTRPVWAWGADQHARYWPRRMLFETAVHRIDLEVTLGAAPDLPVEVAAEGIDEQLENLPFVGRWNPKVAQLRGVGETIAFVASDSGSWRVRLDPAGWWWDRAAGDDDVTAAGTALELLLLVLGRPAPGISVSGDRALLDRWLAATAF
jgi:uncharacterized protein (TIGR03083 family)